MSWTRSGAATSSAASDSAGGRGSVSPAILASGIKLALVTTIFGLTVAIPVLALILILSKYQERYARWLENFVQTRYRPSLEFALRWRYLTLAVGIATFAVTIGLVAGGWIKFSFMPNVEADSITVRLQMPQGTPVGITTDAIGRVVEAAAERGIDTLVVVGRTNRAALTEGAAGAGLPTVIVVDTRDEAVAWVRGNLGAGDTVLYENDLPDHYP